LHNLKTNFLKNILQDWTIQKPFHFIKIFRIGGVLFNPKVIVKIFLCFGL